MVGSKGKGLVFLLGRGFGTGTGGTFTVRAPKAAALALTGGELGSALEEVNTGMRLEDALDLSFRWRAITLVGDADLFLQPRSLGNISRSNLASCNCKSFFSVILLCACWQLEPKYSTAI
ncbi:hypothetical protein HOY80DRAFT_964893 [Tuber brumale]|nr:hypothetical protein HOY80DRAFT_964893 [Tuber brumale]